MRKACHDAASSKADAKKNRNRQINSLAKTPGAHWSSFGHRRHDSGQSLSKKRHFFPAEFGTNDPQQTSDKKLAIRGFMSGASMLR